MPRGTRLRPGRADVVLGLGFALAWAVEAAVRGAGHPARLVLDLAGVPGLAVLVLRRVHPLLVMSCLTAGFCASSLGQWWLGLPSTGVVVPILGLLLASYSVGAHASWTGLSLGAGQPVLTVAVVDLTSRGTSQVSFGAALPFFALFVVALPMLAGRLVWSRNRLVSRLREQQRLLTTERATATEAALAEERLRLTRHLHATLLSGMDALLTDVTAACRDPDTGLPAVSAVERRARELLSCTREVVVSLSDVEAPWRSRGPEGEAPSSREVSAAWSRDRGHAALAWAASAGAVLTVGLMAEVQGISERVAEPIAVLACLLLAAPTALAPRRPLAATVSTWAAAAVFSAAVAPLGPLFAGIALSFLPPFLVAALAGRPRAGNRVPSGLRRSTDQEHARRDRARSADGHDRGLPAQLARPSTVAGDGYPVVLTTPTRTLMGRGRGRAWSSGSRRFSGQRRWRRAPAHRRRTRMASSRTGFTSYVERTSGIFLLPPRKEAGTPRA